MQIKFEQPGWNPFKHLSNVVEGYLTVRDSVKVVKITSSESKLEPESVCYYTGEKVLKWISYFGTLGVAPRLAGIAKLCTRRIYPFFSVDYKRTVSKVNEVAQPALNVPITENQAPYGGGLEPCNDAVSSNLPSKDQSAGVKREVLALSEDALKEMTTDQLWDFVKSQKKQELVIRMNSGETHTYSRYEVKILGNKKPSINELTETYCVEFKGGGGKISETKARLRACGDYFDNIFDREWKTAPLEKQHHKGLLAILEVLKTEDLDTDKDKGKEEAYQVTAQYLQFNPPIFTFDDLPSEIRASTFGPEDWIRYWGKVEPIYPDMDRVLEELSSADPRNPVKKMYETHTLCLIPAEVNGEPLDVPSFLKLTKNSAGNEIGAGYVLAEIEENPERTRVSKSYYVLLSNDVFEGTRCQNYESQKGIVEGLGYRIRKPIEDFVFLLSKYVCSDPAKRDRYFGNDSGKEGKRTYNRTNYATTYNTHLVVGGFSVDGPCVYDDYVLDDYARAHGDLGAAGARKF